MQNILERLSSLGVIPVITIEDARDAIRLGEALTGAGLSCAEITFRTGAAAESIRLLAQAFPEMLVGAGTVFSVEQARQAVESGARFLVTPGFDEAVVDWSLAAGAPIFPGVATPTEINLALRKGLAVVKFFPAEAFGGVQTLQAIAAPYGMLRFIPTGGITAENLGEYLRLPAVIACGGSWMASKSLIAKGDFETITALSRAALELARQARRR